MAVVVEVDPDRCPNGHLLGPGTVGKGWLPCWCVKGRTGHRTWYCRTCGVTMYEPPHEGAPGRLSPGAGVRSGGMSEPDGAIPIDKLGSSIYVVEGAANLLGTGVRLVLQHGITVHDRTSTFATLAAGAETLLKLSVGLCRLAEGQPWPSKTKMTNALRHELTLMHGMTLEGMTRRAANAPPFLLPRIEAVANDVRLANVLGCLDSYAKHGRFHDLDRLGDSEPLGPSPRDRWSAVEQDVLRAEPEITRLLGSADHKTDGWPRLNGIIADSLSDWWALHHLIWMRGEFGRRAQLLSAHLSLPTDLRRPS